MPSTQFQFIGPVDARVGIVPMNTPLPKVATINGLPTFSIARLGCLQQVARLAQRTSPPHETHLHSSAFPAKRAPLLQQATAFQHSSATQNTSPVKGTSKKLWHLPKFSLKKYCRLFRFPAAIVQSSLQIRRPLPLGPSLLNATYLFQRMAFLAAGLLQCLWMLKRVFENKLLVGHQSFDVSRQSISVGQVFVNRTSLEIEVFVLSFTTSGTHSIDFLVPIPDPLDPAKASLGFFRAWMSGYHSATLSMNHAVDIMHRVEIEKDGATEKDDILIWLVEFRDVECVEPETQSETDRLWKLHAGNLKRTHANELATLKEEHEAAKENLKEDLEDLAGKYKKAEAARLEGRRKLRAEMKRAEKAEKAQEQAQAQIDSLKAELESSRSGHSGQVQRLQCRLDKLKDERKDLIYQVLSLETLEYRHANFVQALQDDALYPGTTGDSSMLKLMDIGGCNRCTQMAASMQMTQRYNAALVNTIGTLKNELLFTKGRLQSVMSELEDTNSVDKIDKDQILKARRQQIEELKVEKSALVAELEEWKTKSTAETGESANKIETLTASLENAEQTVELLRQRVSRLQRANMAIFDMRRPNLEKDHVFQAMNEIYEAKSADNDILATVVNVLDEKLMTTLTENLMLKDRVQELTAETLVKNKRILKLESANSGLDIEVDRLEFALDEKTKDCEARATTLSSEIAKLEEICNTLRTIKPTEGTALNHWYLEQKESDNRVLKNENTNLLEQLRSTQSILWQRAVSDAQYMGCAAVLEEDYTEMKSRLNSAIGMIRGLGGPPELYQPLRVRTS